MSVVRAASHLDKDQHEVNLSTLSIALCCATIRVMSTVLHRPKRFYDAPDLPALIDLYESNYVRLMRLVPELESMQGTAVSKVAGALDLYVTVEERFKYTTSLMLTYCFGDGDDEIALEPRARIFVYHDVRSAEIVSHYRRRRSKAVNPWQRGRMPEIERRWQMNRFLNKWLRFCSHQGHLFLQCTNTDVSAHPAKGNP